MSRDNKIWILKKVDVESLRLDGEVCRICKEEFKVDDAVLLKKHLGRFYRVHLNCAEALDFQKKGNFMINVSKTLFCFGILISECVLWLT